MIANLFLDPRKEKRLTGISFALRLFEGFSCAVKYLIEELKVNSSPSSLKLRAARFSACEFLSDRVIVQELPQLQSLFL